MGASLLNNCTEFLSFQLFFVTHFYDSFDFLLFFLKVDDIFQSGMPLRFTVVKAFPNSVLSQNSKLFQWLSKLTLRDLQSTGLEKFIQSANLVNLVNERNVSNISKNLLETCKILLSNKISRSYLEKLL